MPEPKIERYEVIVPELIVPDDYGNITITTTTGSEVRVNKKHEHLHELFIVGRATKVGWAIFTPKDTGKSREYVHTAEIFDGKPPEEKRIKPLTAGVDVPPKEVFSPQETGMWYKEFGEMVRADLLKDTPQVRVMKATYWNRMSKVLGVEIEPKL